LVDSDAYLLHLSKYIHRNPLKAKMVGSLENYRWSSYSAYVGLQLAPARLNCETVLGQLNVAGGKVQAYRRFINDATENKERADFYSRKKQSPILGYDAFTARVTFGLTPISTEVARSAVAKVHPSIDSIVREVACYLGIDEAEIYVVSKGWARRKIPRKLAMYLAHYVGVSY